MGQSPHVGAFNQEQIEILEKAMLRAWEVIAYTDDIPDTPVDRKLLASCIIDAAMTGEENHIKLANDAIFRFRVHKGGERVRARK
jgi:hypothetical protein